MKADKIKQIMSLVNPKPDPLPSELLMLIEACLNNAEGDFKSLLLAIRKEVGYEQSIKSNHLE